MPGQALLPGQAPGQAAGQLASVSQNMNLVTLPGGNHRTWQTDSDVGIRRMIVENILLLFQKRKPRVSQEWRQKLPELVKRLEESLYRDASSKEEYSDLSTLEQRLRAVAKRRMSSINHPNVTAQGTNVSSMVSSNGSSLLQGHGSTPGLGSSSFARAELSTGMAGNSVATSQGATQLQHQSYGPGVSGQSLY